MALSMAPLHSSNQDDRNEQHVFIGHVTALVLVLALLDTGISIT